mmetsp:Transcript_58495/g.163975  ORF Transcript_58495/g.163975 Transcript_58495/m.163975 type:complete len:201 (-) Transcript_58495:388-990(-)
MICLESKVLEHQLLATLQPVHPLEVDLDRKSIWEIFLIPSLVEVWVVWEVLEEQGPDADLLWVMIFVLIWKLTSRLPFLVEKKRSESVTWRPVIPAKVMVSNQEVRLVRAVPVEVQVSLCKSLEHRLETFRHNRLVPPVEELVRRLRNIVEHVGAKVSIKRRSKLRSLSQLAWKTATNCVFAVKETLVQTADQQAIFTSF